MNPSPLNLRIVHGHRLYFRVNEACLNQIGGDAGRRVGLSVSASMAHLPAINVVSMQRKI